MSTFQDAKDDQTHFSVGKQIVETWLDMPLGYKIQTIMTLPLKQ